MSPGWSELRMDEREALRTRLAVDSAADELVSAPAFRDGAARRPRFDEIHSAAMAPAGTMDGRVEAALAADEGVRAAFEALARETALCWFPAAAAASDGAGLDVREGDGFTIEIRPSSAAGDQVYVLIRCAKEGDAEPSVLVVFPDEGPPLRAALPEEVDGVYQLVERLDSPLVRALHDPASRFALS